MGFLSFSSFGVAGDQGELAIATNEQGVPGLTTSGLLLGLTSFHLGASEITVVTSLEKNSSIVCKNQDNNIVDQISILQQK